MPVYLLLYLGIFWVPVFLMALLHWPKMDALTKKAFWITMAILIVATTALEYLYVGLGVWSFSEKIDPLVGIWFGPVPIEEFVFWYGAAPLFLFLYLTFAPSARTVPAGKPHG